MNQTHFISPGEAWTGGDFAPLIQVDYLKGPFQYPEDREYMLHALSLLTHIAAMQRLYTKLSDERQRQRWVQAFDCYMDAARSIFPASYRELESEARRLAMGTEVGDSAGDEVSYAAHCIYVIRRIEIAWKQCGMRKLRQVQQCRACIVQAIRCAFPDECSDELLSEEVCKWSEDGVTP